RCAWIVERPKLRTDAIIVELRFSCEPIDRVRGATAENHRDDQLQQTFAAIRRAAQKHRLARPEIAIAKRPEAEREPIADVFPLKSGQERLDEWTEQWREHRRRKFFPNAFGFRRHQITQPA